MRDPDGSYSTGKLIIDYKFEFEGLKIGDWKSYYSNGQLHSVGNYGIGAYNICRGQAPSVQGYSFRQSIWNYWHPNGELMASGAFTLLPIDLKESTALQKAPRSQTNDTWKFYDAQGQQLKDDHPIAKSINQRD